MNTMNNTVASAAVISPWWIPSLSDISQVTADLLPIAGLLWLVIQIVFYLYGKMK